MVNQLQNIVTFSAVAPGATLVLPHGLNNAGQALVPDLVWCQTTGAFGVTADATNVTATNNGAIAGDLLAYCISWHTIPRVLGAQANLTPQPFITVGAGAVGGAIAARLERMTVPVVVASGATSAALPLTTAIIPGPVGMAIPPSIVIPQTGTYSVLGAVRWAAVVSAAPVVASAIINVNGVSVTGSQISGADLIDVNTAQILDLTAGDVLTLTASQSNAAALGRGATTGSLAAYLVR